MQREMELVRDLLLRIEAGKSLETKNLLDCANGDAAKLAYHLNMLVNEAGFLKGKSHGRDDAQLWVFLELTWDGHEFLDDVRDPEIWRKTKEQATRIGSWSIGTLSELAKGFIKTKIQQHTGVMLG